jgi:hypothetical protein
MPVRLVSAALLILALTACSAAPERRQRQELTRLTPPPRRLLFHDELRGNCAGLTVTLRTHIDRMRELQKKAKQRQDAPPATLLELWQPAPVSPLEDERRRLDELNEALEAKGCKTVDIDQATRTAPDPPLAGRAK